MSQIPRLQILIYLDIWEMDQWSQPGGGGLDVAGLHSSCVWDESERAESTRCLCAFIHSICSLMA